MASELFLLSLAREEVAASAAIVLILILRRTVRHYLGAVLAYRLWWLLPLVAVTILMPGLAEWLNGGVVRLGSGAPAGWTAATSTMTVWKPIAADAIGTWVSGAAMVLFVFGISELQLRRRARLGFAGPAVIGIAAPRFVAPADFRLRFNELERRLIRDHERTHIAEGHLQANLWLSLFLAISWFNPLAYIAVALCRFDQEMACDALVLEAHPHNRPAYRNALLKAYLGHRNLPHAMVGCAWSPTAYKVLASRFRATQKPSLSVDTHVRGSIALGVGAAILVIMIWSNAPNLQVEQSMLQRPSANQSWPP